MENLKRTVRDTLYLPNRVVVPTGTRVELLSSTISQLSPCGVLVTIRIDITEDMNVNFIDSADYIDNSLTTMIDPSKLSY